ncbi:hypothetical protein ACFC1T_09205 [Kitasatospora sp. NPDC056076]|uniref:hypothetical protein n=1 Tax=Kitasatospora sp. NPDC056076 TaxID=3345703 RepID=UPI0035DCBE51
MIVDILRLTECPAKEPCAEDAINVYILADPGKEPDIWDTKLVSCCRQRAQAYAEGHAVAHFKEKAELPPMPTGDQLAEVDRALAYMRRPGGQAALQHDTQRWAAAYCALNLPPQDVLGRPLGTADRYHSWRWHLNSAAYDLLQAYSWRQKEVRERQVAPDSEPSARTR